MNSCPLDPAQRKQIAKIVLFSILVSIVVSLAATLIAHHFDKDAEESEEADQA